MLGGLEHTNRVCGGEILDKRQGDADVVHWKLDKLSVTVQDIMRWPREKCVYLFFSLAPKSTVCLFDDLGSSFVLCLWSSRNWARIRLTTEIPRGYFYS